MFEGLENKPVKHADTTRVRQTGMSVPPWSRWNALLLFCGGGFGGFDFGGGVGVFLGEAFDAAGGVDELLFAGEERVAIGADFDVKAVALDG